MCIENLSDEMKEDYLLSVKKAIGKEIILCRKYLDTNTYLQCILFLSHVTLQYIILVKGVRLTPKFCDKLVEQTCSKFIISTATYIKTKFG